MSVDLLCPLCSDSVETIIHSLKFYHFARVAWALSDLPSHVIYNAYSDLWDWIYGVKQVLTSDQFRFFVCVCWCIWHARNKLVHDKVPGNPQELINFVAAYLKHFQEAQVQYVVSRPTVSLARWKPPTGRTIKINVDASLFATQQAAGLGIIARDAEGQVVAWRQRLVQYVVCPEIAETFAVVQGVDLARNYGWQDIIVECDCKSVIDAINSEYGCFSTAGNLVEEIKSFVSSLDNVVFSHIFRSPNSVAHELSQVPVRNLDGTTELPSSFAL